MKKLFMVVAAAGLLMGVASCAKDGNDAADGGGKSKGKAGLKIALSLPSTNQTRADRDDMGALPNESAPSDVYVYVFNNDATKTAAETGGYTVIPIANFTPQAGGLYELNDGEEIEVSAGEDMRVWVAIDVPNPKAYASEGALLADIAAVAAMSAGAGDFAMFSGVNVIDLVADETIINNDLTSEGNGAVALDRVVSKIVATTDTADPSMWKKEWTNVTLTYAPTHFFIVRDAHTSYLAPHYDVAAYNGVNGADYNVAYDTYGQPETYKGTDFSALNTYAQSVVDRQLSFSTTADANTVAALYVGENASLEEANEAAAKNGNTTYAFISTTVTADAAADWNSTDMEIVWDPATYGGGTSDVFVVRTPEGDVVTNDIDKAQAIELGIAEVGAATLGITLGLTDVDATNMTTATFVGLHPEYDAKIFKYSDGYVHFMHWLNKLEDNHYDVLRNQYIHINVLGLGAIIEGVFPGYPGQDDDKNNDGVPDKEQQDPDGDDDGDGIPNDEDPDDDNDGIPDDDDDDESTIPDDPTDIDDPNNPDPKDPLDPVDPETASMLIDVQLRPWTYRANVVVLE